MKPDFSQERMEQFLIKSGPLYHFVLVVPEMTDELSAAARAGDEQTRNLLATVYYVLSLAREIEAPPADGEALRCLLCDTLFWRDALPQAICVILPYGAARDVLTNGICADCCMAHTHYDKLFDAAVASYKRDWFPSLRLLPPISGQTGHA